MQGRMLLELAAHGSMLEKLHKSLRLPEHEENTTERIYFHQLKTGYSLQKYSTAIFLSTEL